jgi:hypothetical protein
MPKLKFQILWPTIARDANGHATTGAKGLCDKPNRRRRVNDLKARFVHYLGEGLFADAETAERVPASDVCRHCQAELERRMSRALEGQHPQATR